MESGEKNQNPPSKTITGAEFDQGFQQPTARNTHDQRVEECGGEAHSFNPEISSAVVNADSSHVAVQMEIADTQEYSLSDVESISPLNYALLNQDESRCNPVANTLSTREGSSDLSFEEQYENVKPISDASADIAPDSFLLVGALDENDSPNNIAAYLNEISGTIADDKVNHDVVPDYQNIPNTDEVIQHFPHMVV